MLKCRDITERLTDYGEGRMGRWERFEFAVHLFICRHCRRYVRQMQKILVWLSNLHREAPSPAIEDRLGALFRERTHHSP